MRKLTAESQLKLTDRITALVQKEVHEEANLALLMQSTSVVGEVPTPPGLISIRAQLAALRWIQASESTPADWRNRWREVEKQAASIEQLEAQLTHAADELTSEYAHNLLLCLHGQSLIFDWAQTWLEVEILESKP